MERNKLLDIKQRISKIRRKQKITLFMIFSPVLFVLGILLTNSTLILELLLSLCSITFLVGLGLWLYYSTRKTKMIEWVRNYLAMIELKTRIGEHEDLELIQELLSD